MLEVDGAGSSDRVVWREGLGAVSRVRHLMDAQGTEILFSVDNVGPVVAAMRRVDQRGDGRGWVNLSPVLSVEQALQVPSRSGLAAWFSGRGPMVPMATWAPSGAGTRPRGSQVGVAHGTGPNGVDRLADRGVVPLEGWVTRQDHAKHGLVFDLPATYDVEEVVGWMIAAVSALCQVIESGSEWQAVVHETIE